MADNSFSKSNKTGQTSQDCPLRHFFEFSLLPKEREVDHEWWPKAKYTPYSGEWFLAEVPNLCEQNRLGTDCKKRYENTLAGSGSVELPDFYKSIYEWIDDFICT